MDVIKEAERELEALTHMSEQGYSPTFQDIKAALEMTVMIEIIKLLRAANHENRQENRRTSNAN